ncbi:MAG: 50S ribosomal protein L32 [Candidatus Omnitrophica bacterium]|nr:50S ribosomal protein L32 [Candidatus Omnitrophota bacterium]
MPKVKHRHSKSRGRKRRTHYKAESPSLSKCPQCGKDKKLHHVCPYCGYYKGREVKRIETLEERKAKREKKSK